MWGEVGQAVQTGAKPRLYRASADTGYGVGRAGRSECEKQCSKDSGTLHRAQREVGNFNPMQLLEINLIVLALAFLPSSPFHPGPDGVLGLQTTAPLPPPCQAALGTQPWAGLTTPVAAPTADGTFCFNLDYLFFSSGGRD